MRQTQTSSHNARAPHNACKWTCAGMSSPKQPGCALCNTFTHKCTSYTTKLSCKTAQNWENSILTHIMQADTLWTEDGVMLIGGFQIHLIQCWNEFTRAACVNSCQCRLSLSLHFISSAEPAICLDTVFGGNIVYSGYSLIVWTMRVTSYCLYCFSFSVLHRVQVWLIKGKLEEEESINRDSVWIEIARYHMVGKCVTYCCSCWGLSVHYMEIKMIKSKINVHLLVLVCIAPAWEHFILTALADKCKK